MTLSYFKYSLFGPASLSSSAPVVLYVHTPTAAGTLGSRPLFSPFLDPYTWSESAIYRAMEPNHCCIHTHLLLTQVLHAIGCITGKAQQLSGAEGGGRSMLSGKCWVSLQYPALPQKVQQVPIGGIFDCNIQVTWEVRVIQGHDLDTGCQR